MIDPDTEEYVAFLNELYDEELDEALCALVNEAAAVYETHIPHQQEDPQTIGYQAERLLTQHFAPLAAEAETMFGSLARELGRRDSMTLSDSKIETLVDRYRPSVELAPNFEEFLGKLKKAVSNVAKKAVDLAKKGIIVAAKLGLGPILEKLKALVRPLLKRVIQTAIGQLPRSQDTPTCGARSCIIYADATAKPRACARNASSKPKRHQKPKHQRRNSRIENRNTAKFTSGEFCGVLFGRPEVRMSRRFCVVLILALGAALCGACNALPAAGGEQKAIDVAWQAFRTTDLVAQSSRIGISSK